MDGCSHQRALRKDSLDASTGSMQHVLAYYVHLLLQDKQMLPWLSTRQ